MRPRADYDELLVLIHADGFGTRGQKLDTWNVLHIGAPQNVWWGWKNFYDEDRPTFTPQQTDSQFSLAAHVVGWAYHLSNGVTFGVMYVALLGDPRTKAWWWGVVMAVGIELALLLTPYTGFFGIGLTAAFVAATLLAHLIFGAVMGSATRAWSQRSVAL